MNTVRDPETTVLEPLDQHGGEVLDCIRRRRSRGRMRPEAPSRQELETIIEAATWAPNHRLTQPWRFVVLQGAARSQLGEVMARAQAERRSTPSVDPAADFARTAAKPLRAPVIIAVAVEPVVAPKVLEIEEIAAGAAAAQNLLLAAESLGLAAIWRSGDAAYDPAIKTFLGFSPESHILGFIYVGYADGAPPERTRHPIERVTRWLGEPESERTMSTAR